jgi:hypothetical protein
VLTQFSILLLAVEAVVVQEMLPGIMMGVVVEPVVSGQTLLQVLHQLSVLDYP